MQAALEENSVYKWLALGVVVIGTFMAILDSSIVNIAIPKMMAVYGVSTDEIQWVLTGYMLTMGAVIPLTGYLGDTVGTKKTYIFALAAFTLGSALCGFAWSNSAMIGARIIQALGGGMIMPVSMIIIYQVIPPEERGMALGFWGIAAMAAPAIGPTLSGYIVEHLDWRLIFTINIPVGVVGVILAGLLLKESPRKAGKKFDLFGFVSSTVGLVCILYVLGEGSTVDWTGFETVMLLLVGCFSLVLFVANELTVADPLLDLRILKIWPFTLSIIISSISGIVLFGGIFLLPLFLQNLQGYTAMQTGMLMFPGAIATAVAMPIGGKIFDRIGPKPVVLPGLLILTWSTWQLSQLNMDTNPSWISALLAIRGVGIGFSMMPSTTAGMNKVPLPLVARASALSNVVRQVANSMGVAVLSTVMQNRQMINYTRLSEQITWFHQGSTQVLGTLQQILGASGIPSGSARTAAVGAVYGVASKQAALLAINDTLVVTTIIAALSVPLALLISGKKAAGAKPNGPAVDMSH